MSKYILIILLLLGIHAVGQEEYNLGEDHPMVLRPQGHRGMLWDLQISPDERYIITAGQDKTIKFWDLQNNLEERGELLGHIGKEKYGANYAARISPNGKWLAAAGFYGDVDQRKYICDIRIYDMTTRALIKVLSLHKNVMTALRWSRDSRYLISASRDNSIGVWDMETFQLKTQLKGHGDVVYSADVFNNKVVSGSKDNLIMLWDITTGQSTATSFDHFGAVSAVLFDPTGQYIISGSQDKNINIYDSSLMYQNGYAMERSPSSLSFSSDNKFLLVGFDNGMVKVFEYSPGALKEVTEYKPHSGGFVAGIAMTKDGRIISGGGAESNLAMYKIKAGKAEEAFSPVQTSQKVYSAGLDGEVLAFAIGKGNAFTMAKSVNFSKGFNFVSRDYQDLDEYNNVMTVTMGQGLSDRTAKFKGRIYNYKAPIHMMGSLSGDLYDNKVVIRYQELGEDDSWTTQKGKFTGYKNGDIVAQIHSRENKQEFTFTPDSLVVIAGSGGYLRAFDLNGKFVTDFVGHEDVVFSINMSTDHKWLISGSHDHSIRLWETDQVGKKRELWPAATCHFSNDGEWIVATDSGYYMASKNGGKYIGFHQNQGFDKEAKYYPFENFDLKYNRPDKVLERLDMGSAQWRELLYLAHKKRLNKMGISEEVLSDELSLPVVAINTNTQTVKSKIFALEISASDPKFDLNRLNVFINDVPIYGSNGMDLRKSKQTFRQTLELELLPGKNKIQISALNAVGVESLKETVVVYYDAPAIKPELHIVTIGVSNYKDNNYNLEYASKDARDVATLFQGHYEQYSKIHLYKFTDELAQREQILAVKDKISRSSINDDVIIFAAGHGLLDENLDYYFATHDIDFENPAVRGLKFEELEGLLDGIPARNKLMLIDACHSGEVDKEESTLIAANTTAGGKIKSRGFKTIKTQTAGIGLKSSFELMKELFADLRRNNGAIVISSASGKEYAFESAQWQNGVFTYAFLEGIKSGNADANKDKTISVSEIRDYVGKRVVELTNGKQNPTSRTENLASDFRVW